MAADRRHRSLALLSEAVRPVGVDRPAEAGAAARPFVLVVSGSVQSPSHTVALAEAITDALVDRGVSTMHWKLRERPLPIADPDFHEDPRLTRDPVVREFVAAASLADGLALASPLYHNSYSGVLKNALDSLAIAQFLYKPVGLLGHGGLRSTQAVDHLRIVVRGLLGIAIPTHLCTMDADYVPTEAGYCVCDPAIIERVGRFATELILFAERFGAAKPIPSRTRA